MKYTEPPISAYIIIIINEYILLPARGINSFKIDNTSIMQMPAPIILSEFINVSLKEMLRVLCRQIRLIVIGTIYARIVAVTDA